MAENKNIEFLSDETGIKETLYLKYAKAKQENNISRRKISKITGIELKALYNIDTAQLKTAPRFETLFKLLTAVGYRVTINVSRKDVSSDTVTITL